MTERKQSSPRVQWDGSEWMVRLPVHGRQVLEAKWKPGVIYVVRIREARSDQAWSFGFETPLTHFSFVDLKPDTEYELQVRSKSATGEGEPRLIRIHTNTAGNTDNVIPFPRR